MAHVWLALIAALLFMGAYEEFHLDRGYPRARAAAGGVIFSGVLTGAWLVLFGG